MIEWWDEDSGTRIVAACDYCHKEIIGGESAMAAFQAPGNPTQTKGQIIFVHKGQCDQNMEKRLGSYLGWSDIGVALIRLSSSIQLSNRDLRNADLLALL